MKYDSGLVAFIDILGFSKLVTNENNIIKVNDIIEFVGKFQYLFNASPELKVNVAFFSDSIVLTSKCEESLGMILSGIWIAELYLHNKTSLYFRGGITKGLFYHKENIVFGPAVIAAYELEKSAKHCRIIVDESIVKLISKDDISIYRDLMAYIVIILLVLEFVEILWIVKSLLRKKLYKVFLKKEIY